MKEFKIIFTDASVATIKALEIATDFGPGPGIRSYLIKDDGGNIGSIAADKVFMIVPTSEFVRYDP